MESHESVAWGWQVVGHAGPKTDNPTFEQIGQSIKTMDGWYPAYVDIFPPDKLGTDQLNPPKIAIIGGENGYVRIILYNYPKEPKWMGAVNTTCLLEHRAITVAPEEDYPVGLVLDKQIATRIVWKFIEEGKPFDGIHENIQWIDGNQYLELEYQILKAIDEIEENNNPKSQ